MCRVCINIYQWLLKDHRDNLGVHEWIKKDIVRFLPGKKDIDDNLIYQNKQQWSYVINSNRSIGIRNCVKIESKAFLVLINWRGKEGPA